MIKKRWLIIVPFIIALCAGIVLSFKLPKIYQAKTLILVESQRVPSEFVRSVVSMDFSERISTISQQIMSRTNLEKIISDFNLYSADEAGKMYLEDKIADIRRRISVDILGENRRRGDQGEAFALSFTGEDPEKVMNVTNALASYFINENLKVREEQAIGTSTFLDAELEQMRGRLTELEGKLRAYREAHMGELPEQLESNLSILNSLQQQLSDREKSLRDAKNRLAEQREIQKTLSDTDAANAGMQLETNAETSDLATLKKRLELLQMKYTDKHPDIVRLKSSIQALEQKEQDEESGAADNLSQGDSGKERLVKPDSGFVKKVIENEIEIASLQEDIAKIKNSIEVYQKRIEKTPQREQELLSLQRDYQNIKETYSSLLSRKLEAEISVNMEKKQKGERFQIVDAAVLPEKPIKPDMKKLFMMTVALGLGSGCGLVFLMDFLNTSFKRPGELKSKLGLEVLAAIPSIHGKKHRVWNRLNWAFTIIAVLFTLSLLSFFGLMTVKGVDQTLSLITPYIQDIGWLKTLT